MSEDIKSELFFHFIDCPQSEYLRGTEHKYARGMKMKRIIDDSNSQRQQALS